MVAVTLVYPFFQPFMDRSIFRFPPLGLGYLASALKRHGVSVALVDCTFLGFEEAVEKIRRSKPEILGFYSMFSMKKTTLELARRLRGDCSLLVVGGPLPTLEPEGFLGVFDVAVLQLGPIHILLRIKLDTHLVDDFVTALIFYFGVNQCAFFRVDIMLA